MHKRSINTFEIVHSDICVPVGLLSLASSKYFITFADEHTRMLRLYTISSKVKSLKFSKIQILGWEGEWQGN